MIDIVGLNVNPPENALVFCVAEINPFRVLIAANIDCQ
jgi:hypothetical protein